MLKMAQIESAETALWSALASHTGISEGRRKTDYWRGGGGPAVEELNERLLVGRVARKQRG